MPAVTVNWKSNGWPMASTHSPTRNVLLLPSVAALNGPVP
jgi:hypothetical protein